MSQRCLGDGREFHIKSKMHIFAAMGKHFYIVILLIMTSCAAQATAKKRYHAVDTLSLRAVVERYRIRLDSLVLARGKQTGDTVPTHNPCYFHLFAPPLLYESPLERAFAPEWEPSLPASVFTTPALMPNERNRDVMTAEESDKMLLRLYIRSPQVIVGTEAEMRAGGGVREDVVPQLPDVAEEVPREVDFDITTDVDAIDLELRRPNFWLKTGELSFQFSQNYFSGNWYQGGDNNYTMLALVTLEANFDNKQKVEWDNKLEMKLGFQASDYDEGPKVRTSEDLLRFTSKFGYAAAKHWNYSLQLQAYTQFCPAYDSDTYEVSSDFLSPFNLVVSVGMDYKWELRKFSGSANLAPIAYEFTYIQRPSLYGDFGVDDGESRHNTFGPNITVNFTWAVCDNVKWVGRIYCFSDLTMTDIECENTISFTINKFLNAKLFLYPRFDDSSTDYKSDNGSYFMFKEWFSLGFGYSF